ncbi:Hypothetical protein D9617_7g029160 [Elsinoe fawcettii]|nr:Hypothetical protein D9617_7g029160 [Elsinoe fawcettii]
MPATTTASMNTGDQQSAIQYKTGDDPQTTSPVTKKPLTAEEQQRKAGLVAKAAARRIWRKCGKKCYLLELPPEIRYMIYQRLQGWNYERTRDYVLCFGGEGEWRPKWPEYDALLCLAMTSGFMWEDVKPFMPATKVTVSLEVTAPKRFLKANMAHVRLPSSIRDQPLDVRFRLSVGLKEWYQVFKRFAEVLNEASDDLKSLSFNLDGAPSHGQTDKIKEKFDNVSDLIQAWDLIKVSVPIELPRIYNRNFKGLETSWRIRESLRRYIESLNRIESLRKKRLALQ